MTTIDPSWIEIQTGLYQEIIVGAYITRSALHSANGYCFYDKTVEVYREDDKNNLYLVPEDEILPSERTYMTIIYTPITDTNILNNVFVSLPINSVDNIIIA